MNKDDKITQITDDKDDRRNFLKRLYKYVVSLSIFLFASTFGLKRSGEFRLGKMKYTGIGPSEAYGMCSATTDCAGGGGSGTCSATTDCAGGGGSGTCSATTDCAGGGGTCSATTDCAGGGGTCSASSSCAGGVGQCSASSSCAGGAA